MEVAQPPTEVRDVIWPVKAIVLKSAVVLTGWMYTLTLVVVSPQLVLQQALLQRLAVILFLDGPS